MNRLFRPVDIASLVFLRVLFGAIMLWEAWHYIESGWVTRDYIQTSFHFTYFGFGWIHPWPGNGMIIHFVVLGVLATFIMLGLFYRVSTLLFFFTFTYIFLLDQAQYLNHFYFVCLISFLLIFIPAHHAFSLDSLFRPKIRQKTIPAWCVWIIQAQVGIVYAYAAIAKMNADWLNGWPLEIWLAERHQMPFFGALTQFEGIPLLFSYGGLLLDLLIVPALLMRRTRAIGYLLITGFHITNAYMFSIGIFPWFMIVITTIFFSPSWPRDLWHRFKKRISNTAGPAAEAVATPSPGNRFAIKTFLMFYLALQLLIPLRHFLYPGNVHWTEEGHRFSWHMKLRNKVG